MTSPTMLLLISLLLGYGAIGLQSRPANQPYRTAYHFQPVKNWINDPNGPFVYKGIYHLFYQYNPNGVIWGPPVWGHSTSKDQVNWTPQPLTLKPETKANINGSWSGSTTILPGNKPVIFFTGIINSKNDQVQVLAYPKDLSDPYLKQWYLAPQNPVIYPTPQNKINASSFRDPTTAWKLRDGIWRVLVGSKRGQRGLSLLFRSKDFVNWVQAKHPLYSDLSGMWECPDFYPVYASGNTKGADTSEIGRHVKHVLKNSLDLTKHDVYTIGKYNIKKDTFTPDVGYLNDNSLRYDYGKYYASKTFYDDIRKERILLGWANESSSQEDDKKKGWSGIHTIPRKVWLDKSGKQLIQWPISNIEKLRLNPIKWHGKVIKSGSQLEVSGITAAQADVELSFKIKDLKNVERFVDKRWKNPQLLCSQKGASVKGGVGPFGLQTLASKGLEEYTAIFFRIFKDYHNKFVVLLCSDQSRSTLSKTTDKTTYGTFVDVNPVSEGLSLRVLIDHSVVESFGAKGKNVITARVYPTLATNKNAHLYVFNKGISSVEVTTLTAWSMKKAQIA